LLAPLAGAARYTVTSDDSQRDAAACWVLNSCTVKDPSQAAFVNLLKAGRARTVEVPADDDDDGDADKDDNDDDGGGGGGGGGHGEIKGSAATVSRRRMVRVSRPMPLVLCGCVPQADRSLSSLQVRRALLEAPNTDTAASP